MREYWLAHPTDRVVTIYRLANGSYDRPLVYEIQDRLRCDACAEVEINWGRVPAGLPA